jgi:hypothetical protein
LQCLKAILGAAKGNTIDFGDVMIVLIGDPFQLPAIGGASVYAGAAMLAALPGETPATTWQRLVTDVNRKRGGTLKCVYLKPRESAASCRKQLANSSQSRSKFGSQRDAFGSCLRARRSHLLQLKSFPLLVTSPPGYSGLSN